MKYLLLLTLIAFAACNPKLSGGLRKNDLKKDVELNTSMGTIVRRLSDSTSLHGTNFLKLVQED